MIAFISGNIIIAYRSQIIFINLNETDIDDIDLDEELNM